MSSQPEQRVFSGWVYIQRAQDLPNTWVGHLLEYNIVSQGSSPSEALAMVREAAGIAFLDDLNNGYDPHDRRAQATDEDFEPYRRMLSKPTLTTVPLAQLDPEAHREFAVPLTLAFMRGTDDTQCDSAVLAPAHSESTPLAA